MHKCLSISVLVGREQCARVGIHVIGLESSCGL